MFQVSKVHIYDSHGLFRAARSHNPTHIWTLVVLKHHLLLMRVVSQAVRSHRKRAYVGARAFDS